MDEIVSEGLTGFAETPSVECVVSPESDEGDPTCEAMEGLEVVVEYHSEARCSCQDDRGEHGDDDPRSDQIVPSSVIGILDILPSRKDDIEDEPSDSRDTRTGMHPAIMEDLGEPPPDAEGDPVWDGTADFVEEVDKVFLTEEEGDHEIGGCGVSDVLDFGETVVFDHECHEPGHVGCEDQGE